MAGLIGPGTKIASKMASGSKGSSGLAKTATRSSGGAGRTTSSSLKSSTKPSHSSASTIRPSSSAKSSSSSYQKDSRNRDAGHRDAGHRDSNRDPRAKDSGRDTRPGEPGRDSRQDPSRYSDHRQPSDRISARPSDNSRPTSSRSTNQYSPSDNRQYHSQANSQQLQPGDRHQLPSKLRREQHGGNKPGSPLSSTFDRRGGGGGRSPGPHDGPPRKPPLKLSMPSGYQIREGLDTVEKLSYTAPQVVENAQDLRRMMRGKSQGGPPPGQYDAEDDYGPNPGLENPGACRLGFDRQAGGKCGRNGDYAPGQGPGGGPALRPEFAHRGGSGRNDDYTPSPGGGDYGPSEDDYTPSPGGNDYSPSEEYFTPSPSIGKGQKRFDQWPRTKGSNPSGPPTRPGSNLRPAGNRNGPSPLGSGVSKPPPASLQGIETYEFPFEKCPHRMKHMNGPCGAGPYNYSANPAPWMKPTPVAFEGSCLPCDTDLRRGMELEHIKAYQEAYQAELNAFKHQTGREPTGDEHKRTRAKHRNARDSRIKQVWGNWNQRWKSPMVIEFGEDGKAILKKSAV